ncbi:hypothetical protein TWF730_005796 [Orbilia blumenaviensis]|uniref:F-box domain-containing protein n=1 Tax=Orbilia blumenaviensis TaxID=1796055 RepID=A0AAV9VLJ7_9PEZI
MRLLSRKTVVAPKPTPTSPVFLNPKVLETILLGLPAIDVLTRCRGVCKTWKDLIENSSENLKYYSTSGLKRPDIDTNGMKAKSSPTRPRSTPDRKPHVQLLTPVAVDILTIFWRRLAKDGITMGPCRPSRREQLAGIVSRRSERSGRRRNNSSSSMNKFEECIFAAGIILIYMPISAVHKAGSFIRKNIGEIGRKRRAVSSLGKKLIKEFTPVWQKIQIFQSHDPEFRGVLISAGTNWKPDSIDSWDYSLSIQKEFTKLSDASNALMTPLIEAIYSGKLLVVDTPTSGTIPGAAGNPGLGIDLTYEFDDLVTRINRYDGAAKESLVFEAHRPYNVSYKFTRLVEDEGFTWGVSDNTLWRANQQEELEATEEA